MIDPKRMERIWEKDPGLRPVLGGSPLEWSSPHLNQSAMGWWVHLTKCSDSMVEALIRDKCVWWLSQKPCGDGLNLMTWKAGGTTGVRGCVDHGDSRGWVDFEASSPDPTEACLLAVERVLGLEPWERANG